MSSGNGISPYRLSYRRVHSLRFRSWLERADAVEARAQLQASYTVIEHQLRIWPNEWGEPIRDLKFLGLGMRRGILDGIIVEFAVDLGRRIVYISDIRLAFWHPLCRPDE